MFKKFDRDLYNKNDGPAKKIWYNVLTAQGYGFIECEEERYNTDVVGLHPVTNEEVSFELERRSDYHFGKVMDGTYKTAHVPFRKVANKNCSHVYVGLNVSHTHCYTIQMAKIKELADQGKIEVLNCNVDGKFVADDPMVDVPRKHLKFFKILEDGSLEEISGG